MESPPHRLGELKLELPDTADLTGADVLSAILDLGTAAISQLRVASTSRIAVRACLRGTGPGVSFGRLVDQLEKDYPLELKAPFEGSDLVSGGAWLGSDILSASDDRALAKLRWEANATDLPMHTHKYSDRFIIVLEGRGFFHWSDQAVAKPDATPVQTTAARERDVFVFTRGLVHTFSTLESSMALLSVHLPWIPFEASRQYELADGCSPLHSETELRCPNFVQLSGWSVLGLDTGR